jgi:rhodanese-related sulfurtransferase
VTQQQPHSIDELLSEARRGLVRLSPQAAAARQREGALLVDTRPIAQRAADGEIAGSLVIERNVLEWRLDPRSEAAIAEAALDLDVIVFCNEGYSSSLAAATLQRLGITRATDMDGGFQRWLAEGLPARPGGTPAGERVSG